MKELSSIIDTLHQINQQIIEKDNFINSCSDIINIIGRLIEDETFTKSHIYGEIYDKYVHQIQNKISQMRKNPINIEPEFVLPKTNITTSEITGSIVDAPIRTDIYMAPQNRTKFSKKTQKKNNVSISNDQQYIEFELSNVKYFIEIKNNITDDSMSYTYNIYTFKNKSLQIAGYLKNNQIVLINDQEMLSTNIIELKSIEEDKLSPNQEIILQYYCI